MKFYMLDSGDRLVRIIDTKENASAHIIPVYEAKHHLFAAGENSLTLLISGDHPDAILFQEGNKIAYQDLYNEVRWHVFNILNVRATHQNTIEKEVYCEHVFLDLIYEPVFSEYRREAANSLVDRLTHNTIWELGYTAPRLETALRTQNYHNTNVLACLREIEKTYDCELQFRIEYSEEQNRLLYYIDILERVGIDRGKAFVFEKDIDSIQREVDLSRVYTAIYGFGKYLDEEKNDPENRITFADYVWSKEEGHPTDKPYGDLVVKDEEARQRYGLYGGTVHRFGILDDERFAHPETLLEGAWELLQKSNKPYISYQMKVFDLYRASKASVDYKHERVEIGDIVTVIDHYFNPVITEKVRAIEMTIDLMNPLNTDIVLGNHRRDGLGGSGGASLSNGSTSSSGGNSGDSPGSDKMKHATISITDEENSYNYAQMGAAVISNTNGLPTTLDGRRYKILVIHNETEESLTNARAIQVRFSETSVQRSMFYVHMVSSTEANQENNEWFTNWNCIINISRRAIKGRGIDLGDTPLVTNSIYDFSYMNGVYMNMEMNLSWQSDTSEIYRLTTINETVTHAIFGNLVEDRDPDTYRLTWGEISNVGSLIPRSHFVDDLIPLAKATMTNDSLNDSYANQGYAAMVSDKRKAIRNPRAFLGAYGRETSLFRPDAIEIFHNMAIYLMSHFGQEPVSNGYDGDGERYARNVARVTSEGFATFDSTMASLVVEHNGYVASHQVNPRILLIANNLDQPTVSSNAPMLHNMLRGITQHHNKPVTFELYRPDFTPEEILEFTVVVSTVDIRSIRNRFRPSTEFVIVSNTEMHDYFKFGVVPPKDVANTFKDTIMRGDRPSESNSLIIYTDVFKRETVYRVQNRYAEQSIYIDVLNRQNIVTESKLENNTEFHMLAYSKGQRDVYGNSLGTTEGRTYFYPTETLTTTTYTNYSPYDPISVTVKENNKQSPQYAVVVINEQRNASFVGLNHFHATNAGVRIMRSVVTYALDQSMKSLNFIQIEDEGMLAISHHMGVELTMQDAEVKVGVAHTEMVGSEPFVFIQDRQFATIEPNSPITEMIAGTPRASVQQNLAEYHNVLIMYNPNDATDVANATTIQNECNSYFWGSTTRPIVSIKDFMEQTDLMDYSVAVFSYTGSLSTTTEESNSGYDLSALREYMRSHAFPPTVVISRSSGMRFYLDVDTLTSTKNISTSIMFGQLDNSDHVAGRYMTDPSVSNPLVIFNTSPWTNYYYTQDIVNASHTRVVGIPELDASLGTNTTALVMQSNLSNTIGFGLTSVALLKGYQTSSDFEGMRLLMGCIAAMGQKGLDEGYVYTSYSQREIPPKDTGVEVTVNFAGTVKHLGVDPTLAFNLHESIAVPAAQDVRAEAVLPTVTADMSHAYRKVAALYKGTSSVTEPAIYKFLKDEKLFSPAWEVDYISYSLADRGSLAAQGYHFAIIADEPDAYLRDRTRDPDVPLIILNNASAETMGMVNYGSAMETMSVYKVIAAQSYASDPSLWNNVDLAVSGYNFPAGTSGIMLPPVNESTRAVDMLQKVGNGITWVRYGRDTDVTDLIVTKTVNGNTWYFLNIGDLRTTKEDFTAMYNTIRNFLLEEMVRITEY